MRTHTHTPRHVSGSADGRTSVLFSLKSVIFLSRLDGNVPTDVTGSDHPSFIQYRERERGREEGWMRTERGRHTSWVSIQAFLCKLRCIEFEKAARNRLILMKFFLPHRPQKTFSLEAGKFDLRNCD